MPLFPAPIALPWVLKSGEEKSSVATTLTDNTTYLLALPPILAATTITGFRYRATAATGTIDIGLFDAVGNLLAHTGVISIVGSVVLANLGTAYTLAPGKYFLGVWTSGAGASNVYASSSGNENCSDVAVVTATNAGGLQSFSGLSALTMPGSIRILGSAVVQGGLT